MSDPQKIFASLSGAVAVHLLLFLLLIFLISTPTVDSALTQPPAEAGPREVTVMLGDLLDEMETVREEKEELPPEAEEGDPGPRPFIDTDFNAPEAVAPENATFESDRNTTAAAEIMPDPNAPQREGPTTEGDLPIERLTLQKRKFVDGEPGLPAAPPGVNASVENTAVAPEAPVGGGFPTDSGLIEEATSLPPNSESESETGEAEEMKEGKEEAPENRVGPERMRPEESSDEGEAEESTVKKSFVLPGNDPSMALPVKEASEDAFAASEPESEDPVGETQDPEQRQEVKRGGEGDDPGSDRVERSERREEMRPEAERPAGKPGMRPADQGLFATGFSPEQMQSTTNGTLTNLGQNAVDAEATEVGNYKKAVRDAIARKWHQYRIENAAAVTWGILKLKCRVDRNGKVHDLRIVENQANTMLADFSLRAILDAKLPPMPGEVAEELGDGGLQLNYDIIIY